MFKRIAIACLFASTVTLLAVTTARSQTLASARILSSDGPVEIARRSEGQSALMKITYQVSDELFAGDVIKTLKGGRLVLGLVDGSQAIIGEKTTVEVLDLSKSPRTIFNVLRGKTRVRIERAGGRPNPYRVNTPTTVIAVRGTLFDVFVTERETQVFVLEGEVAVSNFARPEVTVILSPGLRTRVEQARPPQSPQRFRPGRNDESFKPPSHETGPTAEARRKREANEPAQRRRADGAGRDAQPPPPPARPEGQRDGPREGERRTDRPEQLFTARGQG